MIFAVTVELSRTALSMSATGLALAVTGLTAVKNELAQARGMEKLVTLTHLCFAVPLSVFGAEHLSSAQAMLALAPRYTPGRMFWVYFAGMALVAASPSIATKIQVR